MLDYDWEMTLHPVTRQDRVVLMKADGAELDPLAVTI